MIARTSDGCPEGRHDRVLAHTGEQGDDPSQLRRAPRRQTDEKEVSLVWPVSQVPRDYPKRTGCPVCQPQLFDARVLDVDNDQGLIA